MPTQTNVQCPELLSPAGSEEALFAAVESGADAVYFGLAGDRAFNARARARNIDVDKLGDIMQALHRRRVRGYVTLNTLVFDDELPSIESLLRRIAETNVDAVLVQDLGIARLIRHVCPDIIMHASTQMSLTSLEALQQAASLGIKRFVLPRELSLGQIASLRRSTELELEVFVHGALCISFSGQCYTSLALGGRSSNRGNCAQPCRMAYQLIAENDGTADNNAVSNVNMVRTDIKPKQLFSPLDLAALPLLPELVKTGVNALKIEGRLKPPEYVAVVTRAYRNAIDQLELPSINDGVDNGNAKNNVTANDLTRMQTLFSRGFSVGWLNGINPQKLVPGNVASHRGTDIGKVIEVRRDAVAAAITAAVRRGDGVLFENTESPEHSQGGRVYEIMQRHESVREAVAGSRILLTFGNNTINADYVAVGQTIRKTDDPQLERDIRQSLNSQSSANLRPLSMHVAATAGQPMRIEVVPDNEPSASFTVTSSHILEAARKHPLTETTLREQLGRLGGTPFKLESLTAEIVGSPMVPLSVLGTLRHEIVTKLETADTASETSVKFTSSLETVRENDVKFFATLNSNYSSNEVRRDCRVHLLLRDEELFEDANFLQRCINVGCNSFYIEPRTHKGYQTAAETLRKLDAQYTAVVPRILMQGGSNLLKRIRSSEPDAVLVRNFGALSFFKEQQTNGQPLPVIADFSFNVVNILALRQMIEFGASRVTNGWDLDSEQLNEMLNSYPAAAEKLETVVIGRMPLFTMEHCLWRASSVPDGENCNALCRRQKLKVKDRRGALHTVRSDITCRNIIENATPIDNTHSIEKQKKQGVKNFRIEYDTRLGMSAEEAIERCCRS
ncbi:MAG: U32 family peptidase [Planctomycetaceae bacterium]|jgi:putative protease|nr:U32 family peptidase [Planctomycetaceae bacterium]